MGLNPKVPAGRALSMKNCPRSGLGAAILGWSSRKLVWTRQGSFGTTPAFYRTVSAHSLRVGAPMKRAAQLCLALAVALAVGLGCRVAPQRPNTEPAPAQLRPTTPDYPATDAFAAISETSLVTRNPVITARTPNQKPDWEGRLNAWIAAWNRGGRAEGRTVRGQAPVSPVVVDGDSIREFRLLTADLLNRVEDLARAGAGWWSEARLRSRRVDLLRPYSLRFHVCDEGNIHLIFFHGDYARQYPEFVRSLGTDEAPGPWARVIQCSWHPRAAGSGVGDGDGQ